ncbi:MULTISPECIES: toprim domain-containing protein [Pseudomonas]|jgi:putative DNA primase/helicase|uniref:Toprim domain-containing protein n=1 Tax=Pseudomonas haemolytica TaxID=2600065 RepID=A0A646NXB4_9PSED|nr:MULTISPECIES: toprim domain-containing protein [Pseudomonas]MBV2083028.1 toprim domain-containing protein [Pseudomonas carnis]MBV2085126.1 toprim domain-containing protein [Pseudomonas carnis]MDO3688688.1 toprim domain-containing protein [Pseudomonas sp. DKN 2791]MDO7034765.1 toprim domain-containing protein [Pseudomonas sp. DKN 2792]MRJ21358.1 toprim domain-containing protein [Pseudomonas haemolytica]
MTDATILFRDALQAVYGPLDWLPEPDGAIHRFRVPEDKPGSLNGWYVLYLDGIASGAFGSWKAGGASTWCSREPVDAREAAQIRERVDQARRQREAEQHRRQQQAAEKANHWWRNARRASPDHPYLIAKAVRSYGLRQRGADLLIPLYLDGRLVNLQRIGPDGDKRFLFGGRIKGAYSPLGIIEPGSVLCICEGWATAASLHQHGGYVVAAAMNAGNLMPVAMALRARYPGQPIVIAGDDDRLTDGNPGRAAANAAAAAVGGQVAFPEWPEGAPDELTDFNDLANWKLAHVQA